MKQSKFPFMLKTAPLALAMSALLTGCGGSSSSSNDDPSPSNNAPSIEDASLVLKSGKTSTLQLVANDQDQDSLTYSIKTQPTKGTASIDANGLLTYTSVENGEYSIVIEVSDGTDTKTGTVNISVKNSAPVGADASITLPFSTPTGKVTYQVSASDHDNDDLTFTIKEGANNHTASVSDSGMLTLTITDFTQSDSLKLSVSDGEATSDIAITVKGHEETSVSAKSFKHQFYSVTNPETSNSQIVHYDSETSQQEVIKSDVILGKKVFVMSGTKDNDKTIYSSREYGLFQDPGASFVTRTGDDGSGGTYEYKFYTDHILKAFSADDTATERLIFSGDSLPQDLKNSGINVIDSETVMHLNETDIDNSYAQIKAYSELADTIRNEVPEEMLHLPITVRLSDGAQTQGSTISLIKDTDGSTTNVLVNFIAPHKKGAYPSEAENKKRLQNCNTALTTCTDITNGEGNYFHLTENDTHVYLTKEGSQTIYAFNKSDNSLTAVTGVEYPAKFDHHHHLISLYSDGGHSTGIFLDFFNLLNGKGKLSEGNDAYAAVNYDLDTTEKTDDGPYDAYGSSYYAYVHKHAMVFKFSGTTGVKVYDNGDGIDHMDESNETDTGREYHLSLVAVKNGNLLVEAAKFNGGSDCKTNSNCITYKEGWLMTSGQTSTKTDFDNTVVGLDIPYLTANRVPPKIIGEHAYINEPSGTLSSSSGRIYTTYKMPITDVTIAKDDASVSATTGRMYLKERPSVQAVSMKAMSYYGIKQRAISLMPPIILLLEMTTLSTQKTQAFLLFSEKAQPTT